MVECPRGCGVFLENDAMFVHTTYECKRVNVECPMVECDFMGSQDAVKEHLRDNDHRGFLHKTRKSHFGSETEEMLLLGNDRLYFTAGHQITAVITIHDAYIRAEIKNFLDVPPNCRIRFGIKVLGSGNRVLDLGFVNIAALKYTKCKDATIKKAEVKFLISKRVLDQHWKNRNTIKIYVWSDSVRVE